MTLFDSYSNDGVSAAIGDVYNCTSCLSEELGLLSKMSKWAKLSELDSCFFAKACLS